VLIYPAVVLMLFLITDSASWKQALRRSYLIFFFFNAFTLYWISSWGSDDIFIKLGGIGVILIHPLFFLIPALLYYTTYRNINLTTAVILFPFYWTGFEYMRNLSQLAFPWIELGNTETYNLHRIQYIEYTGVHGITFLICVISATLFLMIHNFRAGKWGIRSRGLIVCLVSVVLLIILPNVYSALYLAAHVSASVGSKVVKASIIQTNVDAWKKWSSGIPQLMDSYIEMMEKADKENPDLIVLHETAIPFYFFSEYYTEEANKFIDFCSTRGKNILIGIPHLQYYSDSQTAPSDAKIMKGSGRRYDTFNAAVLLEPEKKRDEYTIYEKVKLVPVSERIPYQEYVPFLQRVLKWGVGLGSWQIGKEMTVFKMKVRGEEVRFAVLICFESAFSEYVSEFTDRGAEFLVVITNDGWFGKSSGPHQHQQFAVLRAIENRKWIVRAAQTGISCFIDPLGNVYDRTELFEPAVITKDIMANQEKTFFAKNGDVVGRVSYWIGIAMVLVNAGWWIFKKRIPKFSG